MLISAHIVTAAAAGSLTTNPLLALGIGAASHFIGDKIPHWEYDVNAIHRLNGKRGFEKIRACFQADTFRALSFISAEIILGFLFVWWASAHVDRPHLAAIFAGGLGGFLPDLLWGMANNSKSKLLQAYKRFHHASHTKAENVSLRYGLTWQLVAVWIAYMVLKM